MIAIKEKRELKKEGVYNFLKKIIKEDERDLKLSSETGNAVFYYYIRKKGFKGWLYQGLTIRLDKFEDNKLYIDVDNEEFFDLAKKIAMICEKAMNNNVTIFKEYTRKEDG